MKKQLPITEAVLFMLTMCGRGDPLEAIQNLKDGDFRAWDRQDGRRDGHRRDGDWEPGVSVPAVSGQRGYVLRRELCRVLPAHGGQDRPQMGGGVQYVWAERKCTSA